MHTWSIINATNVEALRTLVECYKRQQQKQRRFQEAKTLPLPEIVIGVIVEEARGTITGVPAAVAHPTKDAAKRPKAALGFILGGISRGLNGPSTMKDAPREEESEREW